MKVIEIKDLLKKDIPLHYRREYTGAVVFEAPTKELVEKRLEFSLENSAIGGVEISVTIVDKLDYPLLPAIKSVKKYIGELDRKGLLS